MFKRESFSTSLGNTSELEKCKTFHGKCFIKITIVIEVVRRRKFAVRNSSARIYIKTLVKLLKFFLSDSLSRLFFGVTRFLES